jgi:hypothetical protein
MRIYTNEDGSLYANALNEGPGELNGHLYHLHSGALATELKFQQGPVGETGINGIQNEQLIAVLVHRLDVLNKTFPCRENSLAITKLEEAMLWLQKRTADRKARGVEGKNIA